MNQTNNSFDVIVIGGGHAGLEAAHAAARMGSSTALVTLDKNKIGLAPCNPSVGGVGKGHIVFEISALDGVMPKICSTTYLQARMLNTKKGPAVQGLRLQIDKEAYAAQASKIVQNTPN
jgi:tRNA uridine 5-carboxymethylaminomethyl modification enzyme